MSLWSFIEIYIMKYSLYDISGVYLQIENLLLIVLIKT